MAKTVTNFLSATVDSVAIPDDWSIIRGFNFVVDAGTDLAGWQVCILLPTFESCGYIFSSYSFLSCPQYSNSFFEGDDARERLNSEHTRVSSSQSQAVGSSSRKSQTNWACMFDEDFHCVRRRLWCRVMCPCEYQERAMAACERYVSRYSRGEILASNFFVELDGCCSSQYKLQRVVLNSDSVEFSLREKRTGVFPIGRNSRVRIQDSRVADKRQHPFLLRIEDTGDQSRGADYITFAMKSESLRALW